MLTFEQAPPFCWRGRVERSGKLRRFVWGWWAVAFYPGNINDMLGEVYALGECEGYAMAERHSAKAAEFFRPRYEAGQQIIQTGSDRARGRVGRLSMSVVPYADKCKRRRDDGGPTPCLCCAGECEG